MIHQHEHLFPDRRIANLADRGITNIIDYSLDVGLSPFSGGVFTVLNKFFITIFQSIAIIIGCIDRLQKEVKEMPCKNYVS